MKNPFHIPATPMSPIPPEDPERKMSWGLKIVCYGVAGMFWMILSKTANYIIISVFVVVFGGGLIYAFSQYESSQYYRDAEITSFVKDDDGQYHFSVVYESGWVQTFHDMSGHKVCVYRKDVSKPTAKIPYTKWHTVSNDGKTAFSSDDKRSALIYLPRNFKIELFDD